MCRFLAYKGREMFMSDLLLRAEQSLIMQSYKAREREEPLNGDGFGVGWYSPEIDPTPCVFTSTTPAWSNRNLHRLAEKIRSCCFFAHVRAASPGSLVSEINCHPFQYREFLWMHNGAIGQFNRVKRRLRESLPDEIYDLIQGTTDSEHAFALFLSILGERIQNYSTQDLVTALGATIARLIKWREESGISDALKGNFALSDGHNIVISRYATGNTRLPPTLYISSGERLECQHGRYRMQMTEHHPHAVIIASEPLTDNRDDWIAVPQNHIVSVSPELHITMTPLEIS